MIGGGMHCKFCGNEKAVRNGLARYSIRDVPKNGKPSIIEAKLQRMHCKQCRHSWILRPLGLKKYPTMTDALINYVAAQKKKKRQHETAAECGLSVRTVKHIQKSMQ